MMQAGGSSFGASGATRLRSVWLASGLSGTEGGELS